MRLIEKKVNEKKIDILFLGHKICSYRNIWSDIIDFNKLPEANELEKETIPERKNITLIYSVYYQHNDYSVFYDTINLYNNYADEIKKCLEIIIVDDCSKYPLTLPEDINLNITLLRIKKDIPWNSCGARNLGVCFASTKKILCMDIDHIVEASTLNNLINSKINEDEFIVFNRIIQKPKEVVQYLTVHPNIFATLKTTFLKYNGYDEDVAGIYGDDLFFRKYLCQNNVKFIKYGTVIANENETNEHHLSRNLLKVRIYLATKKEHTRVMLNFPWEFITSKHYKTT